MNIPHTLAQIIRRSTSLPELLDATVEIVAREMGTDVCSIYLLDPADHRLRLAATKGLKKEALGKVVLALGEGITGIVVSEMRSISLEDAEKHPSYLYFPETGEERFHSYLGVPMAMRNRPVGAIVVQNRERRVFTREDFETLHTIAAQLVGVVENARLVHALDQPDRGRVYIEELRSWNRGIGEEKPAPEEIRGELILAGNAASGGIAIGPAIYRGSYDLRFEAHEESFRGIEKERTQLTAAIDKTRSDVLRIQEAAEKAADEEHALIFSSHLLLLNDPTLLERLEAAIGEKLTARRAVDRVFHEIEAQLEGVGDLYLQERVEDIRDLRNRILSHLLEKGLSARGIGENIVVAHGIPPSLVMELKAQGALGLVTERGGITSHGALLARAMGIPAVTGVAGLVNKIRTGDSVIVDGSTGRVVLRPTRRSLSRYRKSVEKLAATRARLEKLREEPAKSVDGFSVPLLANVGIASEIRQSLIYGAEGIGLYRTEFPFMVREDFPTREEQVHIYRHACKAFPQGTVYFRILDIGGDKYHPRISHPDETNPALGFRSIRLMLDHPTILGEQVQAFSLAAGKREIGILIPMVSSLPELRRAKELIREALAELDNDSERPSPRIGVMIEVPAAVGIASHLAREADFFSIGSNDLIQFTLAADRENSRVAPFGDPYHPSVLRMIRHVVESAHDAGIPVSCCGEMAAIPELAVFLMAMKIDSLSLTPKSIPEVKEAIRSSELSRLRDRVGDVLALAEADSIREAIRRELPALDDQEERPREVTSPEKG